MLVRELARELGKDNKTVIVLLAELGFPGLKHGNKLSEEQEAAVRSNLTPALPAPTQPEPAPSKDLQIAHALEQIQDRCREIPADDYVARKMPNGKTVKLYRPTVSLKKIDGNLYYVYKSLDPEDKLVALSAAEFEEYQEGGKRQFWHMPFVVGSKLMRIRELLRQYSDYTDVCKGGGERFDPRLNNKAGLLLRRFFNPPHSKRPGRRMELAQSCMTHWVLTDEDMTKRIEESWMRLTVRLQSLVGEQFIETRAKEFDNLIREVHDRVKEKMPNVSRQAIAEKVVAYVEKTTKKG